MFKKSFLFSILALIILLPNISLARDVSQITDWYLKDFHSDIVVNTDSSLLITESIVADCGKLPDKHGIFRVLPTQINTPEGEILTPIELVSITDFAGNSLEYQVIKKNNTITWKIGDPNITVKGENEYKIIYKVKNAIRFQENFEELWWNLNGTFWEIETDNYTADIHFPAGLTKDNTSVEHYTGLYGSKDNNLAIWEWQNEVLHVQSAAILRKGEGISLSVTMPKNIFTAYKITFSDKYPGWPSVAHPVFTLIFCFLFWKKYGKDPKLNRTVIAEYEAPDNLTPMQMSMLSGLGFLKKEAIAGSIIKLACDGIIKIEDVSTKVLGFTKKDYKFTIVDANKAAALNGGEKILFDAIFLGPKAEGIMKENAQKLFSQNKNLEKTIIAGIFSMIFGKTNQHTSKLNQFTSSVWADFTEKKSENLLSDVKKIFYTKLPDIKQATRKLLEVDGYLEKNSYTTRYFIYGFSALVLSTIIFSAGLTIFSPTGIQSSFLMIFSFILSFAIFFLFTIFMNRRTLRGAEAEWKIKGFKLFITTAEKYRARFYEKENMFEKILPYAIAFGLTDKWVKAMKDIYGVEKFNSMAPAWFIHAGTGFDVESFSSALTSMTSAISQSTSSSTGAGGGGFSGGGGGGGGGGGW